MTAETDIAAIDDGGANSAAEVRTALTSVLARADLSGWVQDIDNPLTSLTGLTTGNGTWSINTWLQCAVPVTTQCRARTDALLTSGSVFIVEGEWEVPSGFAGSDARHFGFGGMFTSATITAGRLDTISAGIRGDGQAYFEEDGFFAHPAGAYSIPTAGTFVKVRVMVSGDKATLWFDEVKAGELWIGSGVDLVGPGIAPYIRIHSNTAMNHRFRNLKAWSLITPP